MRTTTGKAASDEVLGGDLALAKRLAVALRADGRVSRFAHGFHTYPAGIHPDAARHLLAAFPEGAVLDPFCGGGTVLVEARAAGRRAVGSDINPVALRVARARTALPDEAALTRFRSAARRLTAKARVATEAPPDRIVRSVGEWYAPHVLCELESLRRGVAHADGEVRPLLEAAFSSILVKVSWRRSDTSSRRVEHPRPPGTSAILFHKKCRELARALHEASQAQPTAPAPVRLLQADARSLKLDEPVELVLTSPPYPSTYDYLPMQHLRRVWFDDRPEDEREVGARRHWRRGAANARRRWLDDTDLWTSAAVAALRPGGHLVVVIGDGLAPSGAIDSRAPTERAARTAGLVPLARASVRRIDHARRAGRWEHVLAFQRPVAILM